MKQQFLPRSLCLRLGLFEASTSRVSGHVVSVPQLSSMAVETDAEAASFADYLRKHNLTETLAVFIKEAKLEQQNEVTVPEAGANIVAGRVSKKRKPAAEAKVPDPCVVESVFNALAAGTDKDKTSLAVAENGEKSKKKKVKKDAKEDEKKTNVADWEGVFGKEGEQDANLNDATLNIAEELPADLEDAIKEAEAAGQNAPVKGQKKGKKGKTSQAAVSEPATEKLELPAQKGHEVDKAVDEMDTGEVLQSEKPSKRTTKRGKKSGNEDVQSALESNLGGGATAKADSSAHADRNVDEKSNGAIENFPPETGTNVQPVALDGLTVKGKGKRGKKDKAVAPEEPTQAVGTNGKDEQAAKTGSGGAMTRSRGKKLKEATADAEAKLGEASAVAVAESGKPGDVADAGAAQNDAAPISRQETQMDLVKESINPNAEDLAGDEGKKRGKGKKEKKLKPSDAENLSSEKDEDATDSGRLKRQDDVEMIPAVETRGGEDVGQEGIRSKKGGKKGKKGQITPDSITPQVKEDAASSGVGIVRAENDLVDTTKHISSEVEIVKETSITEEIEKQTEGQQTGTDPTPSKKKGKKSKDRGAHAPAEAPAEAADVTAMAVEPVLANGTEITGNKKRKRDDADGEQKTAEGDENAAEDPSSAVPSKKAKKGDKKPSETTTKTFFQRVDPSKVEILDPRLQNNSYWSKDGADNGWGAKAEEVLGKVRGKDFRHEKTKKKRGSYKGGAIDLQSHSVKFNYPDED